MTVSLSVRRNERDSAVERTKASGSGVAQASLGGLTLSLESEEGGPTPSCNTLCSVVIASLPPWCYQRSTIEASIEFVIHISSYITEFHDRRSVACLRRSPRSRPDEPESEHESRWRSGSPKASREGTRHGVASSEILCRRR